MTRDPFYSTEERLRGIGAMIAAVFVFAIMDSLMKRLSAHYGALQISCLRCLASWLFLLPLIAYQRSWPSLRPNHVHLHVLRAVFGIVMLASFVFAVHRLSLAQTYSLYLTAPLLMTALSVPIHHERVTPKRWVAIVIGLGGVLVILKPWGSIGFSLIAAGAAALATLTYSLSALTVRTLGRTSSSMSMVFWYLLMVGACSGAAAAGTWQPIHSDDWVWLAAIGLSGALGQMWLTDAFRRAPPSVVSPFEYTAILWAFAIDWIFWSVSPSVSLTLGAAIVIGSGVFVVIDERRLGILSAGAALPPP